jgi:excisionase family DNA binding protein
MELLTVEEVAKRLRVAPVTVRRHIAAGRLPAVRVGRLVRVEEGAVAQLIGTAPGTGSEPKGTSNVGVSGRAAYITSGSDAAPESTGKPLAPDDPFWDFVGMWASDTPTDIANHKDEYIADAIVKNWG